MASKESHTWIIKEKSPETIEALETVELVEGEPTKVKNIGANLSPGMKKGVVEFLKRNLDVFAWSHKDMPGISENVIQHQLNMDPGKKPVQQRRKVFALERNKAIMDEVNKLLAAKFIREVYYLEWLANVVIVKKANGKWRMWVDFSNLNQACPKDSFPLPPIDQLVDSIARHKLLTFMDAFLGSRCQKKIKKRQSRTLWLQGHAIRVEERRSYLPKVSKPNVQ